MHEKSVKNIDLDILIKTILSINIIMKYVLQLADEKGLRTWKLSKKQMLL